MNHKYFHIIGMKYIVWAFLGGVFLFGNSCKMFQNEELITKSLDRGVERHNSDSTISVEIKSQQDTIPPKEIKNFDLFYTSMEIMKLGDLFANQQFRDAIRKGEAILGYLEQTNKDTTNFYWGALNLLGNVHYELGNFHLADSLYRLVISLTDGNPILASQIQRGKAFNDLAALNTDLGKYQEALRYYQLSEEMPRLFKPAEVSFLRNFGMLLHELSFFEEAKEYYIRALKIVDELGNDNLQYVYTYNALGTVHSEIGEYEKADSVFEIALTIYDGTPKLKSDKNYHYLLHNIALLKLKLKQYDEAEINLKESIKYVLKYFGPNQFNYGQKLNSLGRLYTITRNYDAADSIFSLATPIFEQSIGKENIDYINNLMWHGEVFQRLGQCEQAKAKYEEANPLMHNTIRRQFDILSEKDKMSFFTIMERFFDRYPDFAFQCLDQYDELPEIIYNDLLSLRGLILNSTRKIFEEVRNQNDPVILSKYEEYRSIKQLLNRQYSIAESNRTFNLDSLSSIANQLEREIVRRVPEIKKNIEVKSWDDVQFALAPGEIAIEFIKFRPVLKENTILYAALILKKGQDSPALISLFEEKQLLDWLEYPSTSTKDEVDGIYQEQEMRAWEQQDYSQLYKMIWHPIESHLEENDTIIYYAPSGLLHRISFPAILKQKNSRLHDQYKLNLVGSTKDLLYRNKVFQSNILQTGLIYGGIQYDSDSASRSDKNVLPIHFLEHSVEELKQVESLFKKNNIFTMTLQGAHASEKSFKSLRANNTSPNIIHLATHGYFLEPEEYVKDFYSWDMPVLLNSVLFFARANRVWLGNPPLSQSEDGILTAYEIADINLSNTKLVVLSACETARGPVRGLEGVYGMHRAFKLAGVDHIIMSLWQVDDQATSLFMKLFYECWFSGMDIFEAVNETQKKMRSNPAYSHPYYWAAFILI